MDNITHALMGIAAAECAGLARKKERVPLWIASALANNLPDLDLLLILGKPHDKLNYLLEHRGYSHTLLLAPLQSTVLLGLLRLWWRKRSGLPWNKIALLVFLGPLLHIFADSLNSYGVHPFWPWENRWHYGDLVFILEPWLWVIFLPVIWEKAESREGKGVALLLLSGLLAISWFHPLVPAAAAFALTLVSVIWLLAQQFWHDDRFRLLAAFSLCALFFGVLGFAEVDLRSKFSRELVSTGEVALTPFPGNPFCWHALTAEIRGENYIASAWIAAPFPFVVSASRCPRLQDVKTLADLQPISGAVSSPGRIPIGEFRGTRFELEELSRSCRAKAFLRFARIPFWKQSDAGKFIGDLRFSRENTHSFSDISYGDMEKCPVSEPPWIGRFYPSPQRELDLYH